MKNAENYVYSSLVRGSLHKTLISWSIPSKYKDIKLCAQVTDRYTSHNGSTNRKCPEMYGNEPNGVHLHTLLYWEHTLI